MPDPFASPRAAPSAEVAPAAAQLGYVRATIAPKLVIAVALGPLSAFGFVSAFALPEIPPAMRMAGGGLYALLLAGAATVGVSSVQGLRAGPSRPDSVAAALAAERWFWRVAAVSTVALYVAWCGGVVALVSR